MIILEQKAFELIKGKLQEALADQGFGEAVALNSEDGTAVMFSTGEVAYGLFYEEKKKKFVLRSTTMISKNEPGQWKELSAWLFDEENTMADADSIARDFLEITQSTKRVELVQSAKKRRKKDEENYVEPLFFFNRLAGVFPELRDEMNEERIMYGQIRPTVFTEQKLAPRCEKLAKEYPDSDPFKRMVEIICDVYGNGDKDTRAVIQFGLLNNIKDEQSIKNIMDNFKEGCDLAKIYKHSRKLMGKNIKPEKKKKEKKIETRLNDR